MIARRAGRWTRLRKGFLHAVDHELVWIFQLTYDIIFILAGLYLGLIAYGPPQNVEPVMGPLFYQAWVWLNVVCPVMTQLGRYLTGSAARVQPDHPNSSVGGATLQLTGDLGIWGIVLIYLACVFQTTSWGQAVYAVFFVGMGVPGGFLFTFRSARRIKQIKDVQPQLKTKRVQ